MCYLLQFSQFSLNFLFEKIGFLPTIEHLFTLFKYCRLSRVSLANTWFLLRVLCIHIQCHVSNNKIDVIPLQWIYKHCPKRKENVMFHTFTYYTYFSETATKLYSMYHLRIQRTSLRIQLVFTIISRKIWGQVRLFSNWNISFLNNISTTLLWSRNPLGFICFCRQYCQVDWEFTTSSFYSIVSDDLTQNHEGDWINLNLSLTVLELTTWHNY